MLFQSLMVLYFLAWSYQQLFCSQQYYLKKTGTFFGLNENITLISVGSISMDHLRNKSSGGGVFSWHLSYIIIPNKRNTLLKSNQTRGNKQDVLIFVQPLM